MLLIDSLHQKFSSLNNLKDEYNPKINTNSKNKTASKKEKTMKIDYFNNENNASKNEDDFKKEADPKKT